MHGKRTWAGIRPFRGAIVAPGGRWAGHDPRSSITRRRARGPAERAEIEPGGPPAHGRCSAASELRFPTRATPVPCRHGPADALVTARRSPPLHLLPHNIALSRYVKHVSRFNRQAETTDLGRETHARISSPQRWQCLPPSPTGVHRITTSLANCLMSHGRRPSHHYQFLIHRFSSKSPDSQGSHPPTSDPLGSH